MINATKSSSNLTAARRIALRSALRSHAIESLNDDEYAEYIARFSNDDDSPKTTQLTLKGI